MFEVEDIVEIQIDLASVCNCKCKFCYRTYYGLKDIVYIDMVVIDKILKECVNLKRIDICGNAGEFVFHPQIFEIIEKFKKHGLSLSISTNGSMYDVEWWKKLCCILDKHDLIIFCIDGLEDTHSRYRGTDYNKVVQNMRTCIDCGINVSWKYIVFRYNEHQIEEAKKRANEYGCSSFVKMYSRRYDDEFPAPSDYIEYENIQVKNNKDILCEFLMCWKVYIDYNGILNPCCYFSTALKDEKILKLYITNRHEIDLKKNSIKLAMQNEIIQYFFKQQSKIDKCRRKCSSLTNKKVNNEHFNDK